MDKKELTELLKDADICFTGYKRNGCIDLIDMGLQKLHEAQNILKGPAFEEYFQVLPYLTIGIDENNTKVTDSCYSYTPTLFKEREMYTVGWMMGIGCAQLHKETGKTPVEAAKKAYKWCIKETLTKF